MPEHLLSDEDRREIAAAARDEGEFRGKVLTMLKIQERRCCKTTAAMFERHEKAEKRIGLLEQWRAWMLGAIALGLVLLKLLLGGGPP